MKQGTPEWFAARRGKITGSNLANALGFGYDSRAEYWRKFHNPGRERKNEIKADILNWGKYAEGIAVDAYELETGNIISSVGFVDHPEIDWHGCSPDGLEGDQGVLEVKCPCVVAGYSPCLKKIPMDEWPTYCESCKAETEGICKRLHHVIPDKFLVQCQSEIQCTEREYCAYICWTPGGYIIHRIERDNAAWDRMIALAGKFYHEHLVNYTADSEEPPRVKNKQRIIDHIFTGSPIEKPVVAKKTTTPRKPKQYKPTLIKCPGSKNANHEVSPLSCIGCVTKSTCDSYSAHMEGQKCQT